MPNARTFLGLTIALVVVPLAASAPSYKGCEFAAIPDSDPILMVDGGLESPPCAKANKARPLRLAVNMGAFPMGRLYPLADSFEVFRFGWESRRVSAELGNTWTQMPEAFRLEVHHQLSMAFSLRLRVGLRRDLSAWHQDRFGGNWPTSAKEVDLNQPSLGYFHAENSWGSLALGRFPLHWSPSPEYGLALSREVPYHNGAVATLKTGPLRYRFLVSSLNPWLEGTPSGDSSGVDFPVGSEEWRQRHYPGRFSDNAHLRVYDHPVKTLIAHRLEASNRFGTIGITELNVIGGKYPDFLDLNPFSIYHNDFKEGFASKAVSGDIRAGLTQGFAALGELFLDDLRYSETESTSSPSIIGWMVGLEHTWIRNPRFRLTQGLHVIRTDALLYRYYQPYNTLHSRIVLTSNNQEDGANPFVDKYVVDYPLGYARGGDALDYRYAARLWAGPYKAILRGEYLTHGGAALSLPYEKLADGTANKDPYQSEEWRASVLGSRNVGKGFAIQAGIGGQVLLFPAKTPRERSSHFQGNLGLSWVW